MVPVSSIGAHRMNTTISRSHRPSIGTEDRSATLYRFCTDTIAVTRSASRNSSSVTFDTPM